MSTIKILLDKIYPLNKTTLKKNCPCLEDSQTGLTYSIYIDLLYIGLTNLSIWCKIRKKENVFKKNESMSDKCPKYVGFVRNCWS